MLKITYILYIILLFSCFQKDNNKMKGFYISDYEILNSDSLRTELFQDGFTIHTHNTPLKGMDCSWISICKPIDSLGIFQIKFLYLLNNRNDEIILTVDSKALILNNSYSKKIIDSLIISISELETKINEDEFIDYKFELVKNGNDFSDVIYYYDVDRQFYKKEIVSTQKTADI